MTRYSFRSMTPQGAVALAQQIACKDDLDALDEAVRRAEKHAVEIFDGPRLVARVKLGNAALNAADAHSL